MVEHPNAPATKGAAIVVVTAVRVRPRGETIARETAMPARDRTQRKGRADVRQGATGATRAEAPGAMTAARRHHLPRLWRCK